MTFPATDVNTTNTDSGTDSPALARYDILDLMTKFNQLRNHVSTYMQGLLSSTSAANARATLAVAPRATRIDVASAAGSVDLSGTGTDDIRIVGALAITGFTVATDRVIRVTAGGAFTLTNGAALTTQTGANIVCAAGDTFILRATAANTVEILFFTRASGASESQSGMAEIATQTEANAGTDDARIITPLKMRFGASWSFTATGYIKFPAWLGGIIVNWVSNTASHADPTTVAITWLQAFGTLGFVNFATPRGNMNSVLSMDTPTTIGSNVYVKNAAATSGFFVLAIGY